MTTNNQRALLRLGGFGYGIMNKKVGIKFKPTGKVYDFDCGAYVLNLGDNVIVETEQGLGFGTVTAAPVEYESKALQMRKQPTPIA